MSYNDYENENVCIIFCPALAISKLFGSRLLCCSLHIGTYIVEVSSFQIPCESFAQNSKFEKFKKQVYAAQYIFCSALHILED